MDDSALTPGERGLLQALEECGVKYLLVGMSAALLQGARGATEDIDLWFSRLDDPRIADAAKRANAIWIPAHFGMQPPMLGGDAIGTRFDVVTHMHGLDDFNAEYKNSIPISLDGVNVRLLPLARILVSKKAVARSKDKAQIPALEDALIALGEGEV